MMRRLANRRGQTGIEFIICIVVLFFFLFMFLSMTILLVTSDYIDYATFMAARTYRSGYRDKQNQITNANIVFTSYMDKISGIAMNPRLDIYDTGNDRSAGVIASYDMDMFYFPPVFVKGKAPPSRIRLSSETHLGRDPGYQECRDFFTNFAATMKVGMPSGMDGDMDDNGC